MPDNFTGLDLGKSDYQSGSNDNDDILGLNKYVSKPSPKPYQPFGGQIQQAPQTYAAPQYYEQPQTPSPQSYNVFSDDELDTYERAKKDYSYINQYSSAASQIANKRKSAYDDFKKNKLLPFFEQSGGFGEFEDDDELVSAIDEMEAGALKTSQMDDGWFGPSDEKIAAGESLKNFKLWSSPNGLRDQYRRLRAERDQYQGIADSYKNQKMQRLEQLTNIPIPAREALDEALKSRGKGPGSKKKMNELLDGMSWEQPVVGYDGEVQNLESVDPRAKINPAIGYDGQGNQSSKAQRERVAAAMRGDVRGVLSRRQHIAKERQLRDKGFFFSESGLLDGRPIGLSRRDVDLLDIDDMRKAGMTSYQGRPLDEAMAELGGEERLEMAKVMESVYSAKSNYEDAQLAFLKVAGGSGAEKAREKMEAARDDMQKTVGLAASYGLDNELFEQAETTSWLGGLGNAIKRGMLMSEMSNYTPDFLTNTLDADEMQKFIEIASEIEKLPTSSTMKRVKETKSDGFLDAIGNLLFDNPAAIPEMFVESLSSFLPSTIKWLIPSAATGAAIGSVIPGAGTAAGAALGARASWGAASFVLEASGMALEGMQELNIDWKNPKVFAAAWTNESIRSKIQKKMVQKGVPIAIADTLTGMMAGKVMGVVNHTGNAMFKGGKLLNKEAFNKAAGSVPRFTLMQKTRNAAVELGADSTMGMGGEYLGQWASKEPGEDWDWDAIAAEGLIGVGPGALGAALEMRGPRANYFGNAPIEIAGEQQTETGTSGTVTRAGYSAPYQTFNDAESMMGHLASFPGVNPETLEFTQKWVDTMYRIRPEQMSKLKIAVSPRTPDANLKNRGTFESRDGHDIMYLNEQEFAADPLGTFMHESGHFARIMILNDEQLMKIWNDLGEPAQKDAYTQYYTKVPEATFDSLSDSEKKKVERAFKRTDNDILAEEWFSYQWARVLAGYKVDKNIANPLKNFKNKIIHPLLGPYIGSESVAGSTGDKGYVIDQQILDFLGYENGMPDPKTPDSTDAPASSVPESKEAMEAKLKAAPGKPADKVKIAKTLNAMAGEKLLSTDISFYTRMEQGSLRAAGADLQEREKALADEGKLVKSVDGGVQAFVSDLVKSDKPKTEKVEVSSKVEEKQESSIKGKLKKPAEIKEDNLKGQISRVKELIKKADTPKKKEALSKRLASLESDLKSFQNRDKDRVYTPATLKNKPQPQVLQKSDSVRESNLKKQIAKTEERIKNAKTKDESTKLQRNLDKLRSKLETDANKASVTMTGKEVPVKETKRNFDKLQKQGEAPTQDIPKETEQFYDDKLLFEKRASEMMALDRLIPTNITLKGLGWVKDISKSVRVDLNKAANSTRDKFKSIEALDKAIDQAIDKLGLEASSGQIIAEVLNLEKLLELAPRSFKSEFERRVNDNIKNNRSREIEDLAAEAHEKIEDYKGQLRTRIADIDKQIDSLGKNDPQEVRNLKQKKGLARKFLDLIAPEEMAIDWKDLPVANLFYLDGKDPKPFTLGMLANKRSKYSGESKIYRKTKTGFKQWKGESRSGQELLWDFVTKFDVTKAPRELGALGTFPDGKVLSPKEYEMALEAVKASAMFNQKRKIGSEAKGKARYEKVEGENVEASKGYPSGYQSEKGGSLAAVVAERLRKNKKLKVGTEPLSLNPTVEEILALKAANGRSLELLGDPSDTERDFNLLVAGILRDGDVKDGEGEYAEIEDYARVAREQIANGTPVLEALRNIPSILQRKKFEEAAREADSESAMSENADIKPRGNKIFITKGFNVPAEKDYNAVKVMDAKRGSETVEETDSHGAFTRSKIFETFDALSSYSEGRTKKEVENFKKNRTNIQKTEEMPDRPISGSREDSDLQSTTDISAADFANWYLSEGPDAKSGKADDARKGGLTRAQKRLRDLQALPSSKDSKQLPGGLGEGLLPYVFVDFARAMYAKLGLKNAKAIYEKAQAASRNSNFKWNYERGTMLVDGKPSDEFKPFVKEAERMTPEGMDILAKPIVQAVIDAEGVDIYNQIDPNEETMLQRDTQMGNTKKEDDSAEMGDDSGEAEDVFETESDAVANEQRKKDLIYALQTQPDALKDRRKVSDELLEEVYYSGTASSIVEAAKEELDRRGVKGIRTLNSDAKILTSDADPNLSKLGILARIAGGKDGERAEEFQKWVDAKKDSVKEGSFKMNMMDRLSPTKVLSESALKKFEKLGLKKGSKLHDFLNVHGRSHQYFGKGGDGLEQSRLRFYDPLIELMRKHSVSQRKIGEYLIARSAPSKNLQIEIRGRELLDEIAKDEKNGTDSAKYKEYAKFYLDKDGNFVRNSGVETKKALEVMAEMESDPKFVKFLEEFLPIYYSMNKNSLVQLQEGGMLMVETTKGENEKAKIQTVDERLAMIKASSRFDFNTGKPDKYGNSYKSKVTLEDDYSYSPLQGFDGETEQFFDQEQAWEDFGSKGGGAGKGFDQPKGTFILTGMFGRRDDGVKSYGPNPDTLLGNAINQHTSAMIRAQKNEVSNSFGNMYSLLYSVLNPNKDIKEESSEFFDLNNLVDPELKEAYDILKTIHNEENKELLKELRDEFNKVFDKPFEASETKMAYELKKDDLGLADAKIGIVRRTLSNTFKNDPVVFTFRRGGQPYFIRFNKRTNEGLRMADAMKNLRYEAMPPILGGFNVGTRLMAKMFTSANLAFILPNFFRDVLTARIHLGEDHKKVLIKDALNHKNLAGFMKAIYQAEADIKKGINPNTQAEIDRILDLGDPKEILASGNRKAMYQYYKSQGGKVDMFRHLTLVEKVKEIQKSLKGKDGWTKKSWKNFWDFIDTANTAVENSIRASTFWSAIKNGRSPDEAAVIARNVTVDFNQKGNLTQAFGSLYVFFGASMNSIDRFFTTFARRTPEERLKLIAAIAGGAFVLNLLNRLMDDDEEEEMPDYDTISSYKRDTNAIIPLPAGLPEFFNDEKDTGYFSLPLPLGYNLFWTLGQVMGDMFAKNVMGRGGTGLVGSTSRFIDSTLSAFNPIGGSSGLAVALTPTPFTPMIELYANKNFMGDPIRYDDQPFEVPKPGHMQDPKSTPEHWNKLSKAINKFLGGSDVVKGSLAGSVGSNPLLYKSDEDIKFDMSGNQMRHLVMGYLGGPGQMADALFGSLFSLGSGESTIKSVNNIPVVNRFLRSTTYGTATRDTFYELRNAIKTAEAAVKKAKEISPQAYSSVLKDNKSLLQLSSQISALDKQKNKLRRLRNKIEGSKALSEEQKTQRVDEIQKKELNLMVAVIKKAQSLGIS